MDSLLDGLGNGIGYTLAIVIIALIREILGTGWLTFGKVFTFIPTYSLPILKSLPSFKGASYDFSRPVFSKATGAFIVFGVVLFVINAITLHKQNKKKFELKKQMMNAAKTAKKGA